MNSTQLKLDKFWHQNASSSSLSSAKATPLSTISEIKVPHFVCLHWETNLCLVGIHAGRRRYPCNIIPHFFWSLATQSTAVRPSTSDSEHPWHCIDENDSIDRANTDANWYQTHAISSESIQYRQANARSRGSSQTADCQHGNMSSAGARSAATSIATSGNIARVPTACTGLDGMA